MKDGNTLGIPWAIVPAVLSFAGSMISNNKGSNKSSSNNIQQPTTVYVTQPQTQTQTQKDNTIMYIAIASSVVLAFGFIILNNRK